MPTFPKSPRLLAIGLTALAGSSLLGCVSQEDYRAEKLKSADLAAELNEVQKANARLQTAVAAYQDQVERFDNAGQAGTAIQANYEMQIAALSDERDRIAARYEELVGKIGTGPALPAALTSELSSYAAQNPDLIEFDADRGIVKFKSDVTFQSGDAEVVESAKTAIDTFASILNSPVARSYQLRVEGHTDNVQNFSANTKAKGHKDNWYLSSHRAIEVAEELISQGISAARVAVVGHADQKPAASNSTAQGRQQNRRVEVLILPQTVQAASSSTQQSGETGEAMPAAAEVESNAPLGVGEDDSGMMK